MTLDDVRRVLLALPETEEGLAWGTPTFRVRGKVIARMREDGELLAIKIDWTEREALTQLHPDTFVATPHYENYPMVLVRLATVDPEEMRELLVEAWRMVAPKRLREAFDAAG